MPHDVLALVARMGGNESLVRRLVHTLKSGYINFGKELSFMTLWLFDQVKRPYLASCWAGQFRSRVSAVRMTPGERGQPGRQRDSEQQGAGDQVRSIVTPRPTGGSVVKTQYALRAFAIVGVLALVLAGCAGKKEGGRPGAPDRPNVIFIMTDDQGYGDLGYTGNPIVKTPHIDHLAGESSQLSDYHVAPTCSPTRAALLTGHWTDRTGVWHTVNGRSMLRDDEVTLGQLLRANGYATGMFGKWHLGDNFPYRPEDRGFTEVYRHGGGGIGQTPDAWDNAYFAGRYVHNGEVVDAQGFCTDVFFDQAKRFIREQAARRRPFLAYIAPNAPHAPLHAPQRYLDMYAGQPANIAAFYAMISNIDDNVGATRDLLRELGIEENTLLIFTTDNGTATGATVFNAGMRGTKGSEYDGGHRVPFIAHWPARGWSRKHVNETLSHAVDVVPTLLAITGAAAPSRLKFDGMSIRALLDPDAAPEIWPDRFLVTDSQRVRDPVKWKQTAVMSQQWRLVNGTELYEIEQDPGQRRDVSSARPDQVAKMKAVLRRLVGRTRTDVRPDDGNPRRPPGPSRGQSHRSRLDSGGAAALEPATNPRRPWPRHARRLLGRERARCRNLPDQPSAMAGRG